MRHLIRTVLLTLVLALAAGLTAGCSKAAKRQRHMGRAQNYLAAGDYDRAEIEFRNALKYGFTNLVALEQLGRIYLEQGRNLQALGTLRWVRDVAPTNHAARLLLAQAFLGAGAFKEARQEAMSLLEVAPTNDIAWSVLLGSSRTTNEVLDVRQRLEKLVPPTGGQPSLLVALGDAHLRMRDLDRAEAAYRRALALDTNSAAAHFGLGNLLALRDQPQAALAAFERAAQLSPPRSRYRLRCAEFKAAQKDAAGARQLLEATRKQAPDYLPAALELAALDLAERRFDACEALLKQVLMRDPLNLPAMTLMPRLRLAQGAPDRAVSEWEKVLKLNPKNPLVHYEIANAALLNNDQARAISSLNQAVTLDPDYLDAELLLAELRIRRGEAAVAVTALKRLLERHPNSAQAHLLLAAAYQGLGQWRDALATYQALSKAFPTNPQPVLLAGLVLQQQGQNAAARATFERVLAVQPDFFPALAQLVQLDLQERQFDAARRRVEAELARNTNSPLPLMLLARVHLAQTNLPQAEANLRRAAALAPDYQPAQAELARLYIATRRYQEALTRLQELTARYTNDWASWLQIGVLQTEATNYTAARQTYEKLLAMNPRYGPALNNLAWLCAEYLGDLDRAYECARRSVELQPGEPACADTLGWVLFKRGDYVRALALLRDSARKLPQEPEVQYHLGLTHYMLGEEAPARVALQTALQLQPDFPGHREARRCLEVLAVDPAKLNNTQLSQLEQAASANPRDPVLLGRLATAYVLAGRTDKAIQACEQALKLNPVSVPVLTRLATLYADRPDKADDALALARKARDLAPDDVEVARVLAARVWARGDHKWALNLYEECARKLPEDARAQFDVALARYSLGQVSAAVEAMRAAQALKPDAPLADEINTFLQMQSLLGDAARAQAALPTVRQVLQTRSNNVPALMVLAAVEARSGNAAEAQRLYERALAVFPSFTPAVRELARLNFGPLQNHEKAYQQALRVRETDRTDLEMARILGVTAAERGEFTRAADVLSDYVRQRADDAEAVYHLGRARFQLKQAKEAREALNRALALQPNAAFAADARKMLAELK